MPQTTLPDLEKAWKSEITSKIRRTLLCKSPRRLRKWQAIIGNEALRPLDRLAYQELQRTTPRTAKHLRDLTDQASMDALAARLGL